MILKKKKEIITYYWKRFIILTLNKAQRVFVVKIGGKNIKNIIMYKILVATLSRLVV